MSITMKSYKQDDLYVELEWDKYEPHYVVFVGKRFKDNLYHTISNRRYATEKQAKSAYYRQVSLVKKGNY